MALSSTLSTSTWYSVTIYRDNGRIRVYVDGVYLGQISNTRPVEFDLLAIEGTTGFMGKIAEVSMYQDYSTDLLSRVNERGNRLKSML